MVGGQKLFNSVQSPYVKYIQIRIVVGVLVYGEPFFKKTGNYIWFTFVIRVV